MSETTPQRPPRPSKGHGSREGGGVGAGGDTGEAVPSGKACGTPMRKRSGALRDPRREERRLSGVNNQMVIAIGGTIVYQGTVNWEYRQPREAAGDRVAPCDVNRGPGLVVFQDPGTSDFHYIGTSSEPGALMGMHEVMQEALRRLLGSAPTAPAGTPVAGAVATTTTTTTTTTAAASATRAAPAKRAERVIQVWFRDGTFKKVAVDATTTVADVIARAKQTHEAQPMTHNLDADCVAYQLCLMRDGITTAVLDEASLPFYDADDWPERTRLMMIACARSCVRPTGTLSPRTPAAAPLPMTIIQVFFDEHKMYTSVRCTEDTTVKDLYKKLAVKPMFHSIAPFMFEYGIFVQDNGTPLGDSQRLLDVVDDADSAQLVLRRRDAIPGETDAQYVEGKTRNSMVSIDDFETLRVVGVGGFGKVYQVRYKPTQAVYAMKVVKKSRLTKEKTIQHTRAEKEILAKIDHPFIIHLYWAFQSSRKLYFVLDFVNGGELFYHLDRVLYFAEERTRFYVAELTCALGYLHSKGVVYRDLKPENCLIDGEGHICITDFGLAKEMSDAKRTRTMCGTTEYVAPEILTGNGYGFAVDWWMLGMLCYECLFGRTAFQRADGESRNAVFLRILGDDVAFPDTPAVSEDAKDFVWACTRREPSKRLGGSVRDDDQVREHPWFAGIDWDALEARRVLPPWIPPVDEEDAPFVDDEYLGMPVEESDEEVGFLAGNPSRFSGGAFAGFEYVAPQVRGNGGTG